MPRFSPRALYAAYPPGFWVIWLGTLINRLGEFVVPLLGFYLSARRGLDITQVTLILSLLGVGRFISEPLGGALSDRYGPPLAMLLSLSGGALLLLALSSASTYLWIVAGVLGYSLLISLYKPAASTAVAALTSGAQRTRAYNLLYWAINVGASVAPLLGGYLSAFSFRLIFVLDAAAMGLYAALLGLFYKDETRSRASRRAAPVRLKRDPLLFTYLLAALLFAITYQGYKLLGVVFVQQGFTAAQYGQVLAVNGALVVLLGLPLGHSLARESHPRWLAVGALLLGLGFGLHAFAATLLAHMLAVVVWSLGEIVTYSISKTIIAELGRAEVRGRYIGLAGSMNGLGALISPLLGGAVLSRFGNAPLWLMLAGFSGVAALIYWRLEGAVLARRAVRVAEELAVQT
ncbi:MFS transporter [Deinococcus sp.]|uniref:MFS transporter n=1 Tax=Deinococcus sp. TaxID=47478 RepID=UPI003B5C588C